MPVHKFNEDFVIAELDERGEVDLSLWFSNAGPLPEPLWDAAQDWMYFGGQDEIVAQPCFRLRNIADCVIDLYEHGKGGTLSPEAKPLVDALISELRTELERLSAVRYEDD